MPGLGAAGARQVEAFFAAHSELTERARALVTAPAADVQPWERIALSQELDGSQGRFRAPRESCALDARDDYAAVRAWLERHESEATRRAYRKEAERLSLQRHRRHSHATHALERGAELTTVRDNLRYASISTTSTYLHGDDTKRAREMAAAFTTPQN